MKVIDNDLLDALSAEARTCERLRKNHNLHEQASDPLQRLLNALEPETYICPHRHRTPAKRELFVPLRGRFVLVTFNESGELVSIVRFFEKGKAQMAEIEPGIWHSLLCEESGTVYFEIKDGPYDPYGDKEFAPWAPPESDPSAATYLEDLRRRVAALEDNWKNE